MKNLKSIIMACFLLMATGATAGTSLLSNSICSEKVLTVVDVHNEDKNDKDDQKNPKPV